MSGYPVDLAVRRQLSLSYKWPVRMANLKRRLLVEYIPLTDSDKKLIVVNLHLEAYAPLKAKRAQMKY